MHLTLSSKQQIYKISDHNSSNEMKGSCVLLTLTHDLEEIKLKAYEGTLGA